MASEQEELLKELKQIVDSLKSVTQFSKDLSAAISSANRPMQQMSDYAKAIEGNISSISKAMEKNAEIQKEMAGGVGELLSKTQEVSKVESESQKNLNDKLAALAVQKTETEALRAAHVAIRVEQDDFWTKETKAGKARNEALQETASWWDRIKKDITDAQLAMAKNHPGLVSASNTAAQGLTGAGNVSGALSAMASSVGNLIPTAGGLGGLMGMILYGKIKEAEFAALGQVAAQQFDQIGGYTDSFANKLTGLTRKLSVAGVAAKEDIAKVTGSMVSMGLTAEDAQTKIHGFTSIAGNDFLALTLSMDKTFEMAAGTAAKFGGTLVRDFNMSTKDAANNLMLMAQAAKESGANVVTFMEQTMQASSALRLMNANQSAVFLTQSGASKAYQRGGLNQQFSGAYAAEGTNQLMGAIGGGMNEGVRAVLAQRMFGGDALDALYKLQSPVARGGKELDVGEFIKQMGNLMKENGVSGTGASYKFSESVFGVGTAGADAFMKAISEQEKGGSVSDATKAEISKGLSKEADKMSYLTRIAEQIKNAVAETMVGLLGLIVGGLKLLYNGVMYGFSSFMSRVTSGTVSKEYQQESDAYRSEASANTLAIGKSAKRVAAGMKSAAGSADEFINAMGFTQNNDTINRIEAARMARKNEHLETTGDIPGVPGSGKKTKLINEIPGVPGSGSIVPVDEVAATANTGVYGNAARALDKIQAHENAKANSRKSYPGKDK